MNRFSIPVVVFLLASTTGASESGVLARGIVVDASATSAYVAVPSGGIDAIDLASGRTRWSSTRAALPLGLVGRHLVAQAEKRDAEERLDIVVFDIEERGRKVLETSVPLPEDVEAIVGDELERSFRATVHGDGSWCVVSWTFTERDVRGTKNSDEEAKPPRIVMGTARIDLATGRVAVVPVRRPAIDAIAEQLKTNNRLTSLPVRAGDVLATTQGGRGDALILKRWDARTGEPLPDRQLLPKALVALPSADGEDVVASERVGSGAPGDPEYRWTVFSAETGEVRGQLRRQISTSPFVLANDNLVFVSPAHGYRSGELWIEEPLTLRAVRLSTSVPAWDHEVRELRYRGPVPPAPASARPRKGQKP